MHVVLQLFQEVLEHIWERGHDNAQDLKVQCNCILLQYNLLLQFQLVLRTNTPTGIEQLFPFPLQISFLVHFSILLESEMKGTRLSITQYFCSALCPTNSGNLTFIIKKSFINKTSIYSIASELLISSMKYLSLLCFAQTVCPPAVLTQAIVHDMFC